MTGGVSKTDRSAAVLLKQPQHRAKHLGMCGNGSVHLRGLEQVGLDQDTFLRLQELAEAAKGLNPCADSFIDLLRVVVAARYRNDCGLFLFHSLISSRELGITQKSGKSEIKCLDLVPKYVF